MKRVSVLVGAVIAAIAASACCILPLLLGVASAGSVGLSAAFAPYRPYLMGLTILLLGAGFYFTYRPEKAACGPDGTCAIEKTRGIKRLSKAMVWLVMLFTVASMAYPEAAAFRTRVQAASVQVAVIPEKASSVAFTVDKMTCAECTLAITDALKKTPGVFDAKVDFAKKRAVVRYDPARVNVAQLRTVIQRTGYPATEAALSSTSGVALSSRSGV